MAGRLSAQPGFLEVHLVLDAVHEFLVHLVFAAKFQEFVAFGFERGQPEAAGGDDAFAIGTPAEGFGEFIV